MKYSKQILSDALAELGESLGRAPKPSDLRPGMAARSTYLRWFGDWETALEYAGYTKEYAIEPEVEAEKPAPEVIKQPEPPAPKKIDPYSPENIRLINLYSKQVILLGEKGSTRELPYAGALTAVFRPTRHARAEILLKYITCGTRILISEKATELFILRPDGEKAPMPDFVPGIYYLVSKKAAFAARDVGRTTLDLIYPGVIVSQRHSPVKIISRLEMLHHPKLWWCEP